MRSYRFLAITALSALFFIFSSEISHAQMSGVTALVKGDAISASGGIATEGSITVYKGTEVVNKTKLTPEGKFIIVLHPGTDYRITFSSTKYYFHEENLSIPSSDKYQEVKMHVSLKELELGRPYTFNNMIFEPKSSDISPNVSSDMESIANALKHNPKMSVSITVYPDESPMGKKAAVQNGLAASRKSAMMAFFSSKNISSSNISVEVSNSVPTNGSFERMVTMDVPVVKTKKKKKAPAPGVAAKKMMVPQYAVIVMNVQS